MFQKPSWLLCFLVVEMVFRRTVRRYFEHFTVTAVLPSPGAVAVKVILPDDAVDFNIATHRPWKA